MYALTEKTAIVTGARTGIGYAAARLFAQQGARVVRGARRETPLRQLKREIEQAGGRAVACCGDVGDEAVARELVDTAIAEFGGLDVAFNNAGVMGALGATLDMDRQSWEETLRTNLTARFLAATHQAPAIARRGGGSILFTGSFVGQSAAFPVTAAYAASKAGLLGLVRTLACELGPRGVRVNALLPGGSDTPMNWANARPPLKGPAPTWRACMPSAGWPTRGRSLRRHHSWLATRPAS